MRCKAIRKQQTQVELALRMCPGEKLAERAVGCCMLPETVELLRYCFLLFDSCCARRKWSWSLLFKFTWPSMSPPNRNSYILGDSNLYAELKVLWQIPWRGYMAKFFVLSSTTIQLCWGQPQSCVNVTIFFFINFITYIAVWFKNHLINMGSSSSNVKNIAGVRSLTSLPLSI